jgi:YVTN family beta-propeller protein
MVITVPRTATASGLQFVGQVSGLINPFAIAFDANDGMAYVNGTNIVKIDPVSVAATVAFPGGWAGLGIDATHDRLFLAKYQDSVVEPVDLTTGSAVGTFPLPCHPQQVVPRPSAGVLYVVCDAAANNLPATVLALDETTGAVLGSVSVAPASSYLAVDQATDTVFVTGFIDSHLQVIRGGPSALAIAASVDLGRFPDAGLAVNSTTHRVYVGVGNTVRVIDGMAGTTVASIPSGDFPIAITVRESVNEVYVALLNDRQVQVIDGVTNTVVDSASVGGGPEGIAASDAGFVVTANVEEGTVTILKEGPAATISGTVLANVSSGVESVGGAFVQACPASGTCVVSGADSGGRYAVRVPAPGTYRVTAFPPGPTVLLPGSIGPFTVAASDAVTGADITLDGPVAPPPGTGLTNSFVRDGLTVVFWSQPATLTATGCAGGLATYELTLSDGRVARSGPMTEGAAGTYTATIDPLRPNYGPSHLAISIACASGTDAIAFDLYIDPSGTVHSTTGAPLPGAVVTLLRADGADGPFAPVPDGSGMMSLANRHNPDMTDGAGQFGWDVIAGFYKVQAQHPACGSASAESAVLTIPPPAVDLDLSLACNGAIDRLTFQCEDKAASAAWKWYDSRSNCLVKCRLAALQGGASRVCSNPPGVDQVTDDCITKADGKYAKTVAGACKTGLPACGPYVGKNPTLYVNDQISEGAPEIDGGTVPDLMCDATAAACEEKVVGTLTKHRVAVAKCFSACDKASRVTGDGARQCSPGSDATPLASLDATTRACIEGAVAKATAKITRSCPSLPTCGALYPSGVSSLVEWATGSVTALHATPLSDPYCAP